MALFGVFVTGTLGFLLQVVAVVAVLLIAGFFLLRFLNKDAAGSWWHLARTKAGQAGDYAAKQDPAAQMRQAAKDAAGELKTADDALIAGDKLKSRLQDQIKDEQKTLAKLEGQVAKKLKDGVPENDPVVVEKLKRIRDLEASIAATTEQVKELDEEYKRNLKQANAASEAIAGAMAEADRLGVQLEMAEQNAKVREMMSKYNPAAVKSKLAAIDKFRQEAKDQLRGHASASKVARDRNQDVDEDDDDNVTPETDEELGGVLARLKAKKGLGGATTPVGTDSE